VRIARSLVLTLALGAAAWALVWFFDSGPETGGSQAITLSATAKGPAPRLGNVAPDFQLTSLDGELIDLQRFRGHPVWVTFWASWCPPCRTESPELVAAYERHAPEGLVIIAVDVGEAPDVAADYAEKAGLPFLIALDRTTEVAAQYRVQGLPTHYFVDADGIIRDIKIGPMGEKEIERRLASILD
jgi:thiol-disulfide isomerase/thioredoxin